MSDDSTISDALRHHALEGARLILIAELLPHLPNRLLTPIGKIDAEHFRAAMQQAIEAYEHIVT